MVIMISLVYGDGRQPGGLAVTGSDVVWQQCGSGDIDPAAVLWIHLASVVICVHQ